MPKKFMVEIRMHEGVWYATCPEMPGFLLCSADRQKLDADIFPAMKQLIAIKVAHHKKAASSSRAAERLVEHKELVFA